MSEALKNAKQALAALNAEERYAMAQFMALHEPCDMHLQNIYECIDYADLYSNDGKPQQMDVHLGMCLRPIDIQVLFKWDEDGEVWEFDKYEILGDADAG